ncbi:hypothetical protein KI387_017282, partial [Taxus chinensis]
MIKEIKFIEKIAHLRAQVKKKRVKTSFLGQRQEDQDQEQNQDQETREHCQSNWKDEQQ